MHDTVLLNTSYTPNIQHHMCTSSYTCMHVVTPYKHSRAALGRRGRPSPPTSYTAFMYCQPHTHAGNMHIWDFIATHQSPASLHVLLLRLKLQQSPKKLPIPSQVERNEGMYRCNVSNAAGTVVSNSAQLTVLVFIT